MKTADELKELKQEAETLNKKPHELTDEELAQVSGGGKMPTTVKTCPSGHTQEVDYFQWMNNYQLWCKGCQAYISGSQWT